MHNTILLWHHFRRTSRGKCSRATSVTIRRSFYNVLCSPLPCAFCNESVGCQQPARISSRNNRWWALVLVRWQSLKCQAHARVWTLLFFQRGLFLLAGSLWIMQSAPSSSRNAALQSQYCPPRGTGETRHPKERGTSEAPISRCDCY